VSLQSRNQLVRRGSRSHKCNDHHDRRADFHDNHDDDNHHDRRNADRPNRDRRRARGVPTDPGVVARCIT
jgi:hypothetical protein